MDSGTIELTQATKRKVRHMGRLSLLTIVCVAALTSAASAQDWVRSGFYTGDGAPTFTVTGLGFTPDVVIIKSANARRAIIKTVDMPDGESKKLDDNRALELDRILTLDADGFTAGTHDDVNKLGVDYHWVAMASVAGKVEVGQYVGDGNLFRAIPAPGVFPDAALVVPGGNDLPVYRTSDMGVWESYTFDGAGDQFGAIGWFDQDKINVGSNHSVNAAGMDYYYVAWAGSPSEIEFGSYLGDGQPGRDINNLTMNPEYMVITNDAWELPVQRPASLTGDASLYFTPLAAANNLIQAMWDGGFQLGSDQPVNSDGKGYYWLAFANAGAAADLEVSLVVDDPTPNEGQTVTITVTATNHGPDATQDVEVTYLLPAGLTFQSATTTGWTYDEMTGLWVVGNMGTVSYELTITALADAGAGGSTLTNTATVTNASRPDPNSANDSATLDITVTAPTGADLHLANNVDDAAPAEDATVTYTISVTNNGPDAATGVQVDDLLPAGLTFQSAVPERGTYDEGMGVWDVTFVNVAETVSLDLVVLTDSGTGGDTIVNTAVIGAVDQIDPNNTNNAASVAIVVQTVDLQLIKIVDDPSPAEGGVVTYAVVVNNLGPAAASGVQVTDLLPAGVTFQSASISQGTYNELTGLWEIGPLAAGAFTNLAVTVSVDTGTEGSTITNTAAVSALDQTDASNANDTSSADITVSAPGAIDLVLSQTIDNGAPNPGDVVVYNVTVLNAGPGDVTGITVADVLPVEVDFVSALTNKGSYDEGTGLWTIGDLADGFQAGLTLQARVNGAAISTTVTNTATILTADQADPDASNNVASADFTVPSSDLVLTKTVDNATPAVGDHVTYTLTVGNNGPNPATNIQVQDLLPAGTSFVAATTATGAYDEGTGLWTVGGLNPAVSVFLTLEAQVLPSAVGAAVVNTAAITAMDQADPDELNNTATANIAVDGTDLELSLRSDVAVALENSDVTLTVDLANNGPQDASGIEVTQVIPVGLTFVSASPSLGLYAEATGVWTVPDLAQGATATLDLVVNVDAGTAGSIIENLAAITAAVPIDPEPTNNSDTASVAIWAGVPSDENILWPLVGTTQTVYPGGEYREVLNFAFVNRGTEPDTLHTLVLTNLTAGTGTAVELDREWQPLLVSRLASRTGDFGIVPVPVERTFIDGAIRFDNLEWAVPAGDTLRVRVEGAASLQARDAAQLRVGVKAAGDLKFNAPFTLIGTWPLVSGQVLEADGFVADQAAVIPSASRLLSIGSERNLALAVDLPGNGYLDDDLYSISLDNRGSAQPEFDLTRIEIWADDGDKIFDPLNDTLLGPATYSGERWQLTGMREPVPAAGRRFFVTVDIAETAQPSRDIRLALPDGNGNAVEMYSGNDGPVDRPLENPNTLGISATNRIILTAEWFAAGIALPGANDAGLLQFVLTNTYGDSRQLQDLTFSNTTEAFGATDLQRDAVCQQVDLRLDANGNGVLDDLTVDTRLGSGIFVDGRVAFGGLDLNLPADSATRLFVTGDLGLMTVADGNRIRGQIEVPSDIRVPNSTIVATWPLSSGTEWVVNGMTAEQIEPRDITVLTLGPSEGPVLAMDLVIPPNGYAADELTGITFRNDGTATAADIQAADLWVDGGDGAFDAGAGDDTPLGPLTIAGNSWTSTVLAEPIPTSGLRVYAALSVSATPLDAVTVKLGLPTGGVTVSSGNDGPVDSDVVGNGTLVISTSPLRTTLTFATAATDTGQSGTLTMSVRNAGSEVVADVVPTLNFVTGTGLITIGAPSPASIAALDPAAEAVFTWTFVSVLPGEVVMEGNAEGLVNGTQVRRSIVTPTAPHRIYTPVPWLDLYPTANLPFSINRGQQGLVPLTLTFINAGGDEVANAHLTSIRLRLLEEVGGAGIVPADLLDQIIVSEGTNIYLATSALPVSGDEVDLVFTEPVVVTGSEPVTLGLRLDLRLNSTVPSFLISIEDATWLVGNDAVNGANLSVVPGEGSFPIRTGQATLVSPADGLNVAVATLAPVSAVPGQTEILLTELDLSQSVVDDNSSSIDVGRLAFKFYDSNGDPLSDPAAWLSTVVLRSAFQGHFEGEPTVEADSLVVLQLSNPVTISGTAAVQLRLLGDVAPESPLGQITAVLASVDHFDARDGNMNNPVPVTLTTAPLGPELTVLGPAMTLFVSGEGVIPAQVSRGTRDLTALSVSLDNPGQAGTAPAAGDTIELEFYNAARQPLDPAPYLDRVRIMRDTAVMGMVVDPVAADGVVAVSVAGGELNPGETAVLRISLDFKPDCPVGTMEVVLGPDGVRPVDAITGERLLTLPAPGTTLPLSSGIASLVIPADELLVSAASLMPPLLAPGTGATAVMSLEFSNPASLGSGGIALNNLTLVQDLAKASDPVLGELLETVQLRRGDKVLALATDLATSAESIVLAPDSLLTVGATETLALILDVYVRGSAPPGPLQLSLHRSGVGAGPPGGDGLEIRVLPASGETFPFTTAVGNIGGASLATSYANFPNPFAAGREPTTFAFSLVQDAQVDLRIMTPHGELVATLLQNDSRVAGLYQDDTWFGLNGNGTPVHNGVYLAELVVRYSDGSRERILRKVAVVR